MSARRRGGRTAAAVRVAVSATLLVIVARLIDLGAVAERLAALDAGWVALGLVLTVGQMALLSWRWRYTAARLRIELPFRTAIGEYYLGMMLNQVLPGGVVGDVSRAWRHARTSAPSGAAVRAVVLERVSAQVVMTTTAIVSVLFLPVASGRARVAVVAIAVGTLLALVAVGLRRAPPDSRLGRIWSDTRHAVLSRDAFLVQLVTAAVLVASYLALYLIAARAVGVDTPLPRLLPLVAPVLMTMLVPVTVAGWGVREGAAAGLWSMVGLTPEEGVAISVAYGLLVLVSTLPGILVLMAPALAGRSRTARPPRAGDGDTVDAAPGPDAAPDRG